MQAIIGNQLDHARPQPIKLSNEEWEKARERCGKNFNELIEISNYRFARMVESICNIS